MSSIPASRGNKRGVVIGVDDKDVEKGGKIGKQESKVPWNERLRGNDWKR